jgi:hypothetical protein
MTEFHPTDRQPVPPNSLDPAVVAERTTRMMWAQLHQREQEQESASYDQGAPASVAATHYPPPGAAAQPQMHEQEASRARRPFNWRLVGWILAVLAAIWILGAAYDIATGHSSAVGAGVFAAVSAVGAIICFAVPRRDDRDS